jgi:hypothetical protein
MGWAGMGWAGSAAGFWPGNQRHIPNLVPGFAFGISQPVEGFPIWSALGDDQDRCTRPANPPKLLTTCQHNQIAGGWVLEVWGHRCTVESHWRLAAKPQPYPEQAEQGQPQVDCSMDRLLGGSVFVSPLAQFSMSLDTVFLSPGAGVARVLWGSRLQQAKPKSHRRFSLSAHLSE